MKASGKPATEFVDHLPDLITEADYHEGPDRKKVRVRIRTTGNGVEILGDSIYAQLVEEMLAETADGKIERMLCG